ncbi:tetratricopeptide repeat protein, partial [Aquimarina spongiae]
MKFILLFVGLFLFLYTNSISAQTSNDTIIAWQYYQKADSLLQARKMDSSIVYFKKALPIYEHAKEWERLMDCYNKISRNYIRKGEYNESISFAKLAIEITEKHFNKNIIQSAVAYNNLGESYESDFNYAEAEKSYKKSVEIKQNLLGDDDIALAYSYDKLGVLYYHISKYDESLTLLKQSLAIYLKFPDKALDKISRNYNNIGNVYDALGKFDKCIFYYEESIKINQKDSANRPIRLAHNYINIGGTYHQINNLDKALLYYNKARVIAEMKEYDRGLLGIYGNMGLSFLNKGEFNKSLEFQKKSLDIALRTLDKNNPYIGTIYISLGDAYGAIGDLETKISYYEKGLLTYQSVFEENHYLIADTYLFLGNLHINRKDYDASDLYFKKALKIYNHLFEEGHPKISEVYLRKGDMYYEQKNYELAIKNYEMGIANLEKAYGKSTLLSAEYHNKIAKIYQIQEQFDKALDNFDKAIQANSNNKNISDISFENSFDRLFILESLIGKGKIFYSLSKKEEAKNHLSNSIKNYKFADDVIDQMRSTYRDYNDKLIFSKKVKEVYQGILEAQLSLFKLEKDQKIVKNILYYTEKNKSSTLKELLNTTTANKFIGLSSAIVELEKSIKTDKAFYQSEIVFEQSQQSDLNNKKIKELESQIFNLNKRQDSLTHIVEKNYPKYYNLKYQNKVISVADIQSKLDEQTTLLEFFTSDSSTYAFTISKNNIDVQELATPDLANKVYGFKQSIISKDLKVYKKYANELYQELISPIASKIKGNQLIIVPDGPLWHLNFDLLLAEQSDANNPKELPYLVKEYIISYANSATLLFDAFKEPKREDVA